ncbi:hypothetical protein P7M68_24790, partial [Vibrio parahaemolyticus]|nr:hypothetical protein [Vibrio parahaemolyticus]
MEKRPSFDDSRFSRLEMEKVTILRRGESLDSKLKTGALKKEGDNLVVVGTQRLGPEPYPGQVRTPGLRRIGVLGVAIADRAALA